MTKTALISAHALAYGHPGNTLGREINLAIGSGEVVCVLGPNGGGKTTLFRTLLGLIPPHAGHITLGTKPLQAYPAAERARAMAYVPQASSTAFSFTVGELVLMGRTAHTRLFARPGANDVAAAAAAIAELNLSHLTDTAVSEISGGERQLALIARALAQQSPLLIMDEPTASLDFGNQALILKEICRLKASGRSVLFSSHNPDHALQCADRTLLMHRGNILALGRPQDVITAANLQMVYGIDVEIIPSEPHGFAICRPVNR